MISDERIRKVAECAYASDEESRLALCCHAIAQEQERVTAWGDYSFFDDWCNVEISNSDFADKWGLRRSGCWATAMLADFENHLHSRGIERPE